MFFKSQRSAFILILILIAAAIVFLPFQGAEFLLWDDDTHLTNNPFLNPSNWQNYLNFWSTPYPEGPSLYIPVTYSFWSVMVLFVQTYWGSNWAEQSITYPFLFLNLAFHLLNGAMIYQLIKTIFKSAPKTAVLFGTLFFIFHPLQLESVVWISGFKELIWVSFALSALLAHSRGRYILTLVFTILSILSKPTAIILPFLIIAMDMLNENNSGGYTKRLYYSILLLMAAIFTSLTIHLQPAMLLQSDYPWTIRPLVALDSVGFYLNKILIPINLGPDYGRTPNWISENIPTREMVYALVGILLFAITLYYRKSLRLSLLLAGGFFVFPLIPVLGIIPFQFQNISTVADRYCYFSVIGISLILVSILSRYPRLKWVGLTYVLLLSFLSFMHSKTWRNNQDFVANALRVNPQSSAFEVNLGIILSKKEDFANALKHFQKAYEINPGSGAAAFNVGALLQRLGQNEKAIEHYERVLRLTPQNTAVQIEYSKLKQRMGNVIQ